MCTAGLLAIHHPHVQPFPTLCPATAGQAITKSSCMLSPPVPVPSHCWGQGSVLGHCEWDSPMPFPALVERYQMSRWKGSCHFPSHSSAQLINRRCQTNKLFLLPIDSNLLAPREPRIVYPTCHPCIAAVLTSALLPSPLLPIYLWGRARHTHGAHSTPHHCQFYPGMRLQLGLLLLLGMADTLLPAAQERNCLPIVVALLLA